MKEMLLDIYSNRFKFKTLIIDHSKCEELDIGASTFMDILVLNIYEYLKKEKRKICFQGYTPEWDSPTSYKVREIIEISGIKAHLNFPIEKGKYEERIKKTKPLKLFGGGSNRVLILNNKEYSSSDGAYKIIMYFESCLNENYLGFTEEGRQSFSNMIGEVIDNCRIHSKVKKENDFYQWYCLGHYSPCKKDSYGECYITIFDFGQTIYEGLLHDSISEITKEELKGKTELHYKKGLFGEKWKEETLWTLYSLQDGVSKDYDEEEDPDRGTGTIKFLNAFQEIGYASDGKKPKMALISGNTYIKFDEKKYPIKQMDFNGVPGDIIAFNEKNDLDEQPDSKFVRHLKNYFPGTIISMKFYIDNKMLTRKEKEEL